MIHLMKEINWVFKMEERGKVECSIHPTISQWSRRNKHHGARSMNEFCREIQQSKMLLVMHHCSAAIENNDIWDVREVFVLNNIKM